MEYEVIKGEKKPNDEYFPKEKYVTLFKAEWEDKYAKFDDYFINFFQYFHLKKEDDGILNKVIGFIFMLLAYGMTFLTQIENGPSIAMFFIIIGQDHMGTWMVVIGFITALVAQFPKRFIFRYRPYMKQRALKLSKDKTSSFPSRAVLCSVVYAYALSRIWNYYYHDVVGDSSNTFGFFGYVLVMLIAAFCSSFSRIHLGVHYPSDCIYGALFGLAICLVSSLIFMMPNIFGCASCKIINQTPEPDGCYGTNESLDMGSDSISKSIILVLVIGVLLVISNWPPLKFWDKSAAVFGSFAACIISQLALVCQYPTTDAIKYQTISNPSAFIWALVLSETNLLISVGSTKLYRKFKNLSLLAMLVWNIVLYLLFTLVTFFFIVKLRLYFMFSS